MIRKSTIQLLRIPFSINLMPIFLFAVYTAESQVIWWRLGLVFFLIHFVFYPASNAYNSYMDNDTGAIAGILEPPPASRELFVVSVVLDVMGLLLSLVIGYGFFLINLVLVFLSRAYSWHGIRIKKYAWLGFIMVALAQGGTSYFNMQAGIQEGLLDVDWSLMVNVAIASLFVGAIYPVTQIYQHEQDAESGDTTLSMKLGIRGTFVFTGLLFIVANGLLYCTLALKEFLIFEAFMILPVAYFLYWSYVAWNNHEKADFHHTMRMVLGAAIAMNGGFITLLILK